MEEDPISLWQHFHGATTHFPIALAIASVAFDLGGLLLKKDSLRAAGFWTMVAAVLSALVGTGTGLYYVYLDPGGKGKLAAEGFVLDTVTKHRNFGLTGTGLLLLAGVIRLAKRDRLTSATLVIYLVLALAGTVFIGLTGFKGGYVARGY